MLEVTLVRDSTKNITVETGLLAYALLGSIAELYALIFEDAFAVIFKPHPVTGCPCDE